MFLSADGYLPNGNPWPGPKFDYKLAWFARLQRHAKKLMASGKPVVLAGDYNVMPTALDAGLRIDHLLLTPDLAKHLTAAGVDRQVRSWEKTSDHAPIWIELTAKKSKTSAARSRKVPAAKKSRAPKTE